MPHCGLKHSTLYDDGIEGSESEIMPHTHKEEEVPMELKGRDHPKISHKEDGSITRITQIWVFFLFPIFLHHF